MADYDIPSTITYGNDGSVSIDAIDAMSEAAAEGDLRGFYEIAETYGSSYGGVAAGYKSIDQSLMGKLSDVYTELFTDGVITKDKPTPLASPTATLASR